MIDVNGFSFVKDNNEYYDSCASILRGLFIDAKKSRDLLTRKIPKMLQTSQFEQKAQNGYLKEWLLLFVTLIVLQNKNSSTRSDHQSLSPYSKAIEKKSSFVRFLTYKLFWKLLK